MPVLESKKFMKYRGLYITRTQYFEMINSIKPFITQVMNNFYLNEKELRYYNYFDFCENVLGYSFVEVPISGKLKKLLAGSVLYENGMIAIGCNSSMVPGRKNFTKLHEITHAQVDIDVNNCVSQNFTDVLTNRGYNSSDQFREIRADICSSYMLITDSALKEAFRDKYSVENFMDDFGITLPALKLRLKNYLVFNINLHPRYAEKLIEGFIKKDNYSIGIILLYMYYDE
nr:MAG TPA: IrrE N-terminal-like domain [Caudoviricetes sp.]